MKLTPETVDSSIYQLMVEQTRDYALFLLDDEGHIVTWNAGAQRIKGYFPDEIIGRHFSRFYPDEAVASGWPDYELKSAAREGRFEDEGWRVRKDGTRFWASVIITALRGETGQLIGFSKITRDLTDRRQAEQDLRRSEERFRLLIEGVTDYAIFMLDPDGVVTSWNSGAHLINGYERSEVIGTHFSRFYTEEDVTEGEPWRELAVARLKGRLEEEGWRVRKDGSRFWARVVVSSLFDEAGHLRGYAKVVQDLTERQHARDLERATRNVNEFIATLAHEIRNPLAPIRSGVQAMARLHANDPKHLQLREMIDRQSAHLVRIADDMVDIARITRGTLQIESWPVRVADVVRRSVEAASPRIEAAGHTLRVELEDDLVVQGDADRLTQIVTNLVNNAARYTPTGGSIAIEAKAIRNQLELSVSDNGQGIEPALQGKIFDMFVQGSGTTRSAGLGIGLGLGRRVAEIHGGSLAVESAGSGKGARFVLKIPGVTKVKALAPAQSLPHRVATWGARKVLVVDDNADAAEALCLLLRALGHTVMVVHDGPSALRAAPTFLPDIVFLDIGMPGMDGYEVATQLIPLKQANGFQVVAVTGWGQQEDRDRSAASGFDMHLVKPVDTAELDLVLAAAGTSSTRAH